MDKVRIGVIGVGIIGKAHLDSYAQISGADVVAICDLDEAELQRVGEKYGIAARYASVDELLRRDDLDAVDVCLHNHLHAPMTIRALQSGKHVYCEKPIAGSYADGKRMVEAARDSGRQLHIQLSFLYSAETRAAKALIDDGRLGRL